MCVLLPTQIHITHAGRVGEILTKDFFVGRELKTESSLSIDLTESKDNGI
jgi:hypothetical protein